MGYLNTQLEKVASAVTDGMEKQALTIADIIRMSRNAVDKGKALHFGKRLMQRNKALANNEMPRLDKFSDAFNKLNDAAELELSFGKAGPNFNELRRLQRRIPHDRPDVVDALMQIGPSTDTSKGVIRDMLNSSYKNSQDAAKALLDWRHARITPAQLPEIVSNLRHSWDKSLI